MCVIVCDLFVTHFLLPNSKLSSSVSGDAVLDVSPKNSTENILLYTSSPTRQRCVNLVGQDVVKNLQHVQRSSVTALTEEELCSSDLPQILFAR